MAQKYFFIAISFYRNIVCQNILCEKGLSETDHFISDAQICQGQTKTHLRLQITIILLKTYLNFKKPKMVLMNWHHIMKKNISTFERAIMKFQDLGPIL